MYCVPCLDHPPQEHIYFVFPVTIVATIHKVVILLYPATSWCIELEGPQKAVGLLEVGTTRVYLMDQVLNTDYAITT